MRLNSSSGVSELFTYLNTLPSDFIQTLFKSPATCLSIWRSLPPLSQQIIMRLLLIEQPIGNDMIDTWVTTSSKKELRGCIEEIQSFHIMSKTFVDGQQGVELTAAFRYGLKEALFSGKNFGLAAIEVEEKHRKTMADLEQYALERWECLLRYMALPSAESEKAVSAETRSVLQAAGYTKSGSSDDMEITSQGFQFLLLDRASQLWSYLLNYFKYLYSKRMDIAPSITFLFNLGFCSLGDAYSTEEMKDNVLDFIQHLREIGLIYQRKRAAGFYYPTVLSMILSIGNVSDRNSLGLAKQRGYLVVETNFRVYAYTESVLQLAVVSTFTDMMYRYPDMSVGILTRESVRRALQVGITANQIIDYMRTNASDHMLKQTPIIPATVTDQIRLWELERDRFTFDDGVLYSNFVSDEEFVPFRNYALQIDALLWQSPASRMIVVTPAGHELVKQWKKQQE